MTCRPLNTFPFAAASAAAASYKRHVQMRQRLEPIRSHHLSPGRIPGSATWDTRSRRTIDIGAGERDRPGVSTNDLFLFFLPRGKRVREWTYLIVQVLHEGISAGLAAQRASLMKEVVESHEFTKLGEDLDESVSEARRELL